MNRRQLFVWMLGIACAPIEAVLPKSKPVLHAGEAVDPESLAKLIRESAKAFSETYQSMAHIPYVGWIQSPESAATAYAAVASWAPSASLIV